MNDKYWYKEIMIRKQLKNLNLPSCNLLQNVNEKLLELSLRMNFNLKSSIYLKEDGNRWKNKIYIET